MKGTGERLSASIGEYCCCLNDLLVGLMLHPGSRTSCACTKRHDDTRHQQGRSQSLPPRGDLNYNPTTRTTKRMMMLLLLLLMMMLMLMMMMMMMMMMKKLNLSWLVVKVGRLQATISYERERFY